MNASGATAAKGNMPFPHRTCAEWMRPLRAPLSEVAEPRSGFTPAPVEEGLPPNGVWVMGYFPHMLRSGGSLSQWKGWFPCRRRGADWQVQIGSYRSRFKEAPSKWRLATDADRNRPANDWRKSPWEYVREAA